MTALTDQGLGLGTDDVCDMALAAATAMTVKTLVGKEIVTWEIQIAYLVLYSLPS